MLTAPTDTELQGLEDDFPLEDLLDIPASAPSEPSAQGEQPDAADD